MRKLEHILAAITLLSLFAAWYLGRNSSENTSLSLIQSEFTSIDTIIKDIDSHYLGISATEDTLCYFVCAPANGYAGPMLICVQFDTHARILKVVPLEHMETEAFFHKMVTNGLLDQFTNTNVTLHATSIQQVDVISGATFSSQAVIEAVELAAGRFGEKHLGLEAVPGTIPDFDFGLRESMLIILLLCSMYLYKPSIKYRKQIRWLALSLSILVLGFMTVTLLSIVNLNSFLMGYWPNFQSHLIWYLMLVVVFVPILINRKNHYCNNICPFGATQEFLGKLGKAKTRIPRSTRKYLIWLPRILAWIFILLALLSNQPAYPSHEIFSTFFSMIGDDYQFVIVATVLLLSLFISKPWCHYLCPIKGATDFAEYGNSLFTKAKSVAK